jgi:hypothetical protein
MTDSTIAPGRRSATGSIPITADARYGYYNDKIVRQFAVDDDPVGHRRHGGGRADRRAAVLADDGEGIPGSVTGGCGPCTPTR